jgi:hypothetical protein
MQVDRTEHRTGGLAMTQGHGPHLPFLRRLAQLKAITATGPSGLPHRPGILIIEHEDNVRHALARCLRRHGYPVWQAADEQEALAVFKNHGHAIELVMDDFRLVRLSDLLA